MLKYLITVALKRRDPLLGNLATWQLGNCLSRKLGRRSRLQSSTKTTAKTGGRKGSSYIPRRIMRGVQLSLLFDLQFRQKCKEVSISRASLLLSLGLDSVHFLLRSRIPPLDDSSTFPLLREHSSEWHPSHISFTAQTGPLNGPLNPLWEQWAPCAPAYDIVALSFSSYCSCSPLYFLFRP